MVAENESFKHARKIGIFRSLRCRIGSTPLSLGYAVQGSFGGSRAGVGVVVQVYVELSSGLGDLEGSNRIHYAVEVFKIGAEDYEFH